MTEESASELEFTWLRQILEFIVSNECSNSLPFGAAIAVCAVKGFCMFRRRVTAHDCNVYSVFSSACLSFSIDHTITVRVQSVLSSCSVQALFILNSC